MRWDAPGPPLGHTLGAMGLAGFILAAIAYGVAAALFAYVDDEGRRLHVAWARGLLAAGALFHLVAIGARCVGGVDPLRSVFLAADLVAWFLVAGYLALSRGGRLAALGLPVAGAALLGACLGAVFGAPFGPRLPKAGAIGLLHVLLATVGTAGFALASVVALGYLALERRLRSKRFRPGEAAVSLMGLERLGRRILLGVAPIFTLAVVTGVLWLAAAAPAKPGGLAALLAQRRAELLLAGGAFLAALTVLAAQGTFGIRGRRAAYLTIASFAAVVGVFVTYGLRPS